MKKILIRLLAFSLVLFINKTLSAQSFQGKAYYYKKTKMELGSFGARMSEQQKKQIESRLKNRLEKTYLLTFNKEESIYKEIEKLDGISGATDSWGKNFSPGKLYKNVKTNTLLQHQEFYGKRFLIKDNLQSLKWNLGSETKQIGNYTCFKATAVVPSLELEWWSFSWDRLSNIDRTNAQPNDTINKEAGSNMDLMDKDNIQLTQVIAWYSPQIPAAHGPLEYNGLPGLILEVSAGNTIILCSKIIYNPDEKEEIDKPSKGEEVTKKEYQEIVINKMREFRDNRLGRR